MPVAVLSGAVQASEAQVEPIRHRSNRFRIATRRGYAAAEWLGSTSRFQRRLRQPLGTIPAPATQPFSVRALRRSCLLLSLLFIGSSVVRTISRRDHGDTICCRGASHEIIHLV